MWGAGVAGGALLLLAACSPQSAPIAAPKADRAPPATDGWIGRWMGPEGLFLDIRAREPGSGRYRMTLKDNLDSQAEYEGQAMDGEIRFVRAGKPETIRRGTGVETGFKYLADKRDCLILAAGREGYCRD